MLETTKLEEAFREMVGLSLEASDDQSDVRSEPTLVWIRAYVFTWCSAISVRRPVLASSAPRTVPVSVRLCSRSEPCCVPVTFPSGCTVARPHPCVATLSVFKSAFALFPIVVR